jgi:hypothetical protein
MKNDALLPTHAQGVKLQIMSLGRALIVLA